MVNMSDPDWSPPVIVMDESKARKKTSSVWKYCEVIDDAFALCTICQHKLSYKSSVTNLRKHFKKRHPEVSMPPNLQYVRNGITVTREARESSDDEERNETQRATNTVIVDYLRPAGEENRPKFSNIKSAGNFSKYAHSIKRERSPERFDCRMGSKYSRHKPSEETEFELFGRSIVMQLKTLPLVHALEVQAEITNLIVQKRIQALRHSQETLTEEAPMQYALVYATGPSSQENCQEVTHEISNVSSKEVTVEDGGSVSC